MNKENKNMARRSIKKVIEREFIADGFKLVDNWKDKLPEIENSIKNTIELSNKFNTGDTIHKIDYIDLIDLVKDAIDNYNLIEEFPE